MDKIWYQFGQQPGSVQDTFRQIELETGKLLISLGKDIHAK